MAPREQPLALVPSPAGVPPAAAACRAYVEPRAPCSGLDQAASARELLARAVATVEPLQRDAALGCLENDAEFEPGLLRALRAELAPIGCADVLALEWLEPRRAGLARGIEDALIALAAAGKLSRLVGHAPELGAPFDKQHFAQFFKDELKPWIVAQASAIRDLARVGPGLTGYEKGVVAIEAGLADMRFVSVVRAVALPKEMEDDVELREAYYAALDEALEPRKARGRDAALVGLREFASAGILSDPRLDRARALLGEVYSGRRIDALDQLLLPPLSPVPLDTTEQRLAARLPTFYAGYVLAHVPVDAPLLRALLERGLPPSLEPSVQRAANAAAAPEFGELLARRLVERGRRYFRVPDFSEGAELAQRAHTPSAELYQALSASLAGGPKDASELLLGAVPLPSPMSVVELDRLTARKDALLSPLSAFDAASLLELAPPQNSPQFWADLQRRFELAARELRNPEAKERARRASAAARATRQALLHPAAARPTPARAPVD